MGRNKINEKDKKIKISISLDRITYYKIKNEFKNVSKYIETIIKSNG